MWDRITFSSGDSSDRLTDSKNKLNIFTNSQMSQHTIHSYFAKADENGDIAPAASSSASSSRSIPAILGGRKRKAVSAPNAPLLETEDVEDRRVLAAVQNVCINNASSSSSSRQPLSTLHSDNLTGKSSIIHFHIQLASVNKPTLGQPCLGLLSGGLLTDVYCTPLIVADITGGYYSRGYFWIIV